MNASSDVPSRGDLLHQLRSRLDDDETARQRLRGYLASAREDLGWLMVDVDGALGRLDQEGPAAAVLELLDGLVGYFRHVDGLALSPQQQEHVELVERETGHRRREFYAGLAQLREASAISAAWATSPADPDEPPPISSDEVAAARRLIENALAWLRYDRLYNDPALGLHILHRERQASRGRPPNDERNLLEALLADAVRGTGIDRAAAARLVLDMMRAHRAELQAAGIDLPSSAKAIEQRLMARDKRGSRSTGSAP